MTEPARIVIGRGGLLGAAIARRFGVAWGRTGVDWEDPQLAARQVAAVADDLAQQRNRGGWWAMWCAGAGFVGAGLEGMQAETRHLETFLDRMRPAAANGVLFLASSAGGVHGGSPLSTELSSPAPISDYGREKLRQEHLVQSWCEDMGGRAVVGRISNLYGPGQNLAKPQGLVSRLVRASLLGQPLTLFVPLDTTREYFFAADAAALAAATMQRAEDELEPGESIIKLMSSGRLTTVGAMVAELARIRKRRPPVVFARDHTSDLQPRVLAFHSLIWPDLDALPKTSLAVGIDSVARCQMRALGAGSLS